VVREAGRKAHILQLERLAGRGTGAMAGTHSPPPPPSSTNCSSSDSSSSDSSDGDDYDNDDDGVTSRGLDYRSSLERQRNRLIAIRAVLECQRRLRNGQLLSSSLAANCPLLSSSTTGASSSGAAVSPDVHLALISAKCTRWSRELAALIGKRDFYSAYPELRTELKSHPLPELSSLDHLKPFPKCLQRSISTGMATRRCDPSSSPLLESGRGAVIVAARHGGLRTPAILTTTLAVGEEEEDSDDEARRRLVGIKSKNVADTEEGRSRKRRRVATDARSAAAVLVGC